MKLKEHVGSFLLAECGCSFHGNSTLVPKSSSHSFKMQWKILFSMRTKKLGQIIITYLARNSNRNSENHVWTLLYNSLTFYVIYVHLCIFSMPSSVNICCKRKIPIGQQLVSIIIIYGEKMPVIHNHTWCLYLKCYISGCIKIIIK